MTAGAPTVAVVGDGAIGGILARAVHDAGHPVTLYPRPGEELVIETAGRRIRVPVAAPPARSRQVDWLLYVGATGWPAALAGRRTTVLVPRNGLDHAERLGALAGPALVLPALVRVRAERLGPDRIAHRDGNRLVLPAGAAGRAFRDLVAGSGLRVELSGDFRTESWRCVLAVLAGYPGTALTSRGTDALDEPEVAELARGLLTEALAVAVADGAHLGLGEIDRTMHRYRAAGGHAPGDDDEDAAALVAVARAAAREHVAVPLCRAVLALLRARPGR